MVDYDLSDDDLKRIDRARERVMRFAERLCKRCNAVPGVEILKAPCGCVNFFCEACLGKDDLQRWLASYSKLHERVGGRYCGAEGPLPCPTDQEGKPT